MKKIIKLCLIAICLFTFQANKVYSKNDDRITVTLDKCVDGDTAYFKIKKESVKVRFLAIDTPESTNKIEPYGKDASDFTCNKLKTADLIELEYDSAKTDKYGRTLAWIFVDDILLQDLIIKEGLARVAYLYDDYKYTSILQDSEKIAKEMKLNIWSDYTQNNNTLILIISVIAIIILYIFSSKFRKTANRKVKNKIKKEINSILK